MENDVDQMQIDYQNQQVKRLSKGVCGVEIGLIFTDKVIDISVPLLSLKTDCAISPCLSKYS